MLVTAKVLPRRSSPRLIVRAHDEIVSVARVEGGENFEVMAGGDRREHGAAACAADVNAAGGKAGDQGRRTADENGFHVDAVLGKESLLLGEPERHDARGEGGVADSIFTRRRGAESMEGMEGLYRDQGEQNEKESTDFAGLRALHRVTPPWQSIRLCVAPEESPASR